MRKVFKKSGFTLVELLVVMGIIGILMALLFPAIGAARKAALKAQAQTEVRAIATAIEAYFNEYGKLPIPDDYQGNPGYTEYYTVDLSTTDEALGSREVIKILTANDMTHTGAKNLGTDYDNIMNPRKIIFLEAQSSDNPADAQNGVFLDPWGEQYLMCMDSDYNGKVEFFSGFPGGGLAVKKQYETVTKNAIVYSIGPDTTNLPPHGTPLPNSDYKDFISSSFD
ncbi:MAG: type II secretion system protein [Kiritimatiellae bacterium]|nr:type II secretion system protein [Kiritimatiellia bacterium]